MANIIRNHRIHVMDENLVMNLVAFNTEITRHVSNNDTMTKLSPFLRPIELLVHVPVKPKRAPTHLTVKTEVFESLFERLQPSKLGVASNH